MKGNTFSVDFKVAISILIIATLCIVFSEPFVVWTWFRILFFLALGIEGCRRSYLKCQKKEKLNKWTLTLAISYLTVSAIIFFTDFLLIHIGYQPEDISEKLILTTTLATLFVLLVGMLTSLSFILGYPFFYKKVKNKILVAGGWILLIILFTLLVSSIRDCIAWLHII